MLTQQKFKHDDKNAVTFTQIRHTLMRPGIESQQNEFSINL